MQPALGIKININSKASIVSVIEYAFMYNRLIENMGRTLLKTTFDNHINFHNVPLL
jgi:hypothetical protein